MSASLVSDERSTNTKATFSLLPFSDREIVYGSILASMEAPADYSALKITAFPGL